MKRTWTGKRKEAFLRFIIERLFLLLNNDNLKFILRTIFITFALASLLLQNCKEKEESPVITLLLPTTRSPLFYNGDTMFVKAEIQDNSMLTEASLDIRNAADSSVHFRSFLLQSANEIIMDTFVFHVNDHSNFIMTISAANTRGLQSKLPVFIHVMP